MNVLGPRIRVRPTLHTDLPFLQALWNDGVVMRPLGYPDGLHATEACMERWWSMTPQAQSPDAPFSLYATPHCLLELLDATPIGELSYTLDSHQRARIDLKLAARYWKQGYAAEALTIVLRELFATTPVRSVVVEPSPSNAAALRLLQRCGFHPAPTENHPNRWDCTRADFARRRLATLAEVA